MSDILSSLITPEMRVAFTIILVVLAVLYLMSIVWVVRDSYLRGASPLVWGIIAVIPFVGCMIYAMLRPPLYASDQEEQNIDLLLKQRQLMSYGECPQCGYPTERDYVICPNCHVRLKNVCPACGRPLEPEWTICPYCEGKGNGVPVHSRTASRSTRQRRVTAASPAALDSGAPAAEAVVSGTSSPTSRRTTTRTASPSRTASTSSRATSPSSSSSAGSTVAAPAPSPAGTRTSSTRQAGSGQHAKSHAPQANPGESVPAHTVSPSREAGVGTAPRSTRAAGTAAAHSGSTRAAGTAAAHPDGVPASSRTRTQRSASPTRGTAGPGSGSRAAGQPGSDQTPR